MDRPDYAVWVAELLVAARLAGEQIQAIRDGGLSVESKADHSPVTQADRASEALILAALARLTPDVPVISEESGLPPWENRRQWRELWLVDPLDGTREFVAGRDEFTVNIAYVRDGSPELGLIHHPVSGATILGFRCAAGSRGWQCFSQGCDGAVVDLAPRLPTAADEQVLRVVVSRSHQSQDARAVPETLRQAFPRIQVVGMGSALKFCLLATGDADFYVRRAPCCEWDTAAGQAILAAVGGGLCDLAGKPLRYNQSASVYNPSFYAYGPRFAGVVRLEQVFRQR